MKRITVFVLIVSTACLNAQEADIVPQDELERRFEEAERGFDQRLKEMQEQQKQVEKVAEGMPPVEPAPQGTPEIAEELEKAEQAKAGLDKKFNGGAQTKPAVAPVVPPMPISTEGLRTLEILSDDSWKKDFKDLEAIPPKFDSNVESEKDKEPGYFGGYLGGNGIGITAGALALIIGTLISGGGLLVGAALGMAAFGAGKMIGGGLTGEE